MDIKKNKKYHFQKGTRDNLRAGATAAVKGLILISFHSHPGGVAQIVLRDLCLTRPDQRATQRVSSVRQSDSDIEEHDILLETVHGAKVNS